MDNEAMIEAVARAIATGCNLEPDAISPKAAKRGHQIPEWYFFQPAARAAINAAAPFFQKVVEAELAMCAVANEEASSEWIDGFEFAWKRVNSVIKERFGRD